MRSTIFLLSILLLGTSVQAAPVYSWVDENGQKHFSDRPPPPGAKARDEKQEEVTPTNTQPPSLEGRQRLIGALQARGVQIIYHHIPGPQPAKNTNLTGKAPKKP